MEDRIQLTDPTTGLSTRDAFEHLYGFAFSLGDRGVPPTLLFVKPDGEEMPAKEALDELGRTLRQISRRTDVVARYEPDEFICLLVACNRAGALVAADRIRSGMADVLARIGTTVSVGVASYQQDMDDPADLVGAARSALGSARAGGGDRTEVDPST